MALALYRGVYRLQVNWLVGCCSQTDSCWVGSSNGTCVVAKPQANLPKGSISNEGCKYQRSNPAALCQPKGSRSKVLLQSRQ